MDSQLGWLGMRERERYVSSSGSMSTPSSRGIEEKTATLEKVSGEVSGKFKGEPGFN